MAGERDSPEPLDCKDVGIATLNLPDRLPARSPIRVKFAISRDGRLNVTATDLTGGGSIDVEFETEAVMNAEEVAERSTALRLLTRLVRGGSQHGHNRRDRRSGRPKANAGSLIHDVGWQGYPDLLEDRRRPADPAHL